jgi:hypothetical protein
MYDDLHLAVHYHQGGQLEQAARIYRSILARHADHADALHLPLQASNETWLRTFFARASATRRQ